MKKKAFALMLAAVCVAAMCSGCGKGKTDDTEVKTPDNVLPTYYSDENEIPSDTYCIAHKEKNKNGMCIFCIIRCTQQIRRQEMISMMQKDTGRSGISG